MLPPLLPAVAARRSTRGARDPIAGNLLAEERNRPLTATLCMLMSLFLSQSRQGPRGLVALLQQVPRAQEPRSSQCARVCLCCNGLPARPPNKKEISRCIMRRGCRPTTPRHTRCRAPRVSELRSAHATGHHKTRQHIQRHDRLAPISRLAPRPRASCVCRVCEVQRSGPPADLRTAIRLHRACAPRVHAPRAPAARTSSCPP